MFAKLAALVKYVVWLFMLSLVALLGYLVYTKATTGKPVLPSVAAIKKGGYGRKAQTARSRNPRNKYRERFQEGGMRNEIEEQEEQEEQEQEETQEEEEEEEYDVGGYDEGNESDEDADADADEFYSGGQQQKEAESATVSYSAMQRVMDVVSASDPSRVNKMTKSQVANTVMETLGAGDIMKMSDSKLKKEIDIIIDNLSVKQPMPSLLKDRKWGGDNDASAAATDHIQNTLKEVQANLEKLRSQTSSAASKVVAVKKPIVKESFINRHANSTRDTLVLDTKSAVEWGSVFLPGLDPTEKYAPIPPQQ